MKILKLYRVPVFRNSYDQGILQDRPTDKIVQSTDFT